MPIERKINIEMRKIENEYNLQCDENGTFLHFEALIEDMGVFEWILHLHEYLSYNYTTERAMYLYRAMIHRYAVVRKKE